MSESNVTPMRTSTPELVKAVRAEMEKADLSQSAAARSMGIGGSSLSQWLSDKYPADPLPVEEKIQRWLKSREVRSEAEAEMPTAPAWIETPSARRVRSALSYAQIAGDIAVVYGGAGVGKTLTAYQYRLTAPNCWLVTMTPATASFSAALERIAIAVKIEPAGRAARTEAEIIERLRGTQGLLIIDEAQHLSRRALESIRSLQDATGIGVALLGNKVVYTQLTGSNRGMGFAQLFSRIGKRVELTRPTNADADALADAWGVTDSGVIKLLRDIARRPGALRDITKCMRLACTYADGKQPTFAHIKSAYADLTGGVA